MLSGDNAIREEFDETDDETVITQTEDEAPQQHKGGQPSIVFKFPEIVDQVSEFIKQNGFSTQNWRRTGYSNGVTAKQIQDHLHKLYPTLKEHKISLSTIRRMFTAPNKHFTCESKQNAYREFHPDAHYLFFQNKMRREFGTLLADQVNVISVDDMAKIKVSAQAVSRYH